MQLRRRRDRQAARRAMVAGGAAAACLAGALAAVAAAPATPRRTAAAPPARTAPSGEVEHFEKRVRPVLAEHCYSCHGEKVQQGGLRVDSRPALLRGGNSGPALHPSRPGDSLLVKAVRYDHTRLKMPPGGRLPAAAVAALEHWVAAGAPWPDSPPRRAAAGGHWAFRPVRRPPVPPVKQAAWVRTPVDAFVLARLEAAGLSPSPAADRRTLLRRVTFDLTGLPPTPAELDAFLADTSPDAYEKVVDRLLASPRYGERWARHWLDVARFADTKDGVLMYGDARIRPFAYTYRDYVIRALNEDTPYDRFVHEQLAADQLTPPVEPWRLAAMGFLTLGRMFDNNVHDVLDDRIDVTTRGFLGLTVACARCHDHKYDPVPTADYYSLYGVFASSEVPVDLPPTEAGEIPEAARAFEREYAAKRAEVRSFVEAQHAEQSSLARTRVADYLVRAGTEPPDPLETAIFFLSLEPGDLRPQIVARWRRLLEQRARPDDPVFGPWSELMALEGAGPAFREASSAVLRRWQGRPAGTRSGQLNPLVREALEQAQPQSRAEVARAYGALLLRVFDQAGGSEPRGDAAQQQLFSLLAGPDSPAFIPRSQTYHYMSRGEKDRYGGLLGGLDQMAVKAPIAVPRAMVLQDLPEPHDTRILVRGNPSTPGERVPRRFLAVATSGERHPFPHGSGRLDLARAITAPDNPLTARVLVNRVWMHHFGEPLVATPGDFGARSTPPSHPELLDWLADTFRSPAGSHGGAGMGWSLKRLHRLLVLSAVYRQGSADRPAARTRDPENRLLWRAHRRRLELEAMRDAMLAVAGRLDTAMYGRPVDAAGDPECRRRTVYGLVDRQSLPGVYRAFDFASPDASADRRPTTTVPQQALFGMNHPFVVRQARALAALPQVAGEPDPARRVQHLYREVLLRPPSPPEAAQALQFLLANREGASEPPAVPGPRLTAWEQLAQVLLLTNEFLFLD